MPTAGPLRVHPAEWVGRTADDGKQALSVSTPETKNKNRNSNQ
jgi:hypothetical protein